MLHILHQHIGRKKPVSLPRPLPRWWSHHPRMEASSDSGPTEAGFRAIDFLRNVRDEARTEEPRPASPGPASARSRPCALVLPRPSRVSCRLAARRRQRLFELGLLHMLARKSLLILTGRILVDALTNKCRALFITVCELERFVLRPNKRCVALFVERADQS